MSRLGHGAEGMATAIGLATLAPGGTVAVPAALVMDEVEHYRAGLSVPNLTSLLLARPCRSIVLFPAASTNDFDHLTLGDLLPATLSPSVAMCASLRAYDNLQGS